MIPRHHHSVIPSRVARLVERMRSHDIYLHAHSLLVARLSLNFASHLGFSLGDQRLIERAALLHDVGKLRIDLSLLHKPTALNETEWARMRTHPEWGHSILESEGITDGVLLDVVKNHHERLDGTGYPAGLQGKEVSEIVRVVTLCDVFAATTESRSYGTPHTWQAALERMARKHTRLDMTFLRHFAAMIAAKQMRPSGSHRCLSADFFVEVKHGRKQTTARGRNDESSGH